jgi:hypothetical protein
MRKRKKTRKRKRKKRRKMNRWDIISHAPFDGYKFNGSAPL